VSFYAKTVRIVNRDPRHGSNIDAAIGHRVDRGDYRNPAKANVANISRLRLWVKLRTTQYDRCFPLCPRTADIARNAGGMSQTCQNRLMRCSKQASSITWSARSNMEVGIVRNVEGLGFRVTTRCSWDNSPRPPVPAKSCPSYRAKVVEVDPCQTLDKLDVQPLDAAWGDTYRVGFPACPIWWRLRHQQHEGALVAVYVVSRCCWALVV